MRYYFSILWNTVLKNDQFMSWFYIVAFMILIASGNLTLAVCTFYIPSVIFIYKKRNTLAKSLKVLIGASIFTGILFFSFRIYAEKIINLRFLIEPEYINYSSSIYAFFLSLVAPPIIFFLLYSFYALLKLGLRKVPIEQAFQTIIIIVLLLIPVKIYDLFLKFKIIEYIVFIDAYNYSDCIPDSGEALSYIYYLRKDKNSCYQITWPSITTPPQYKTITSIK